MKGREIPHKSSEHSRERDARDGGFLGRTGFDSGRYGDGADGALDVLHDWDYVSVSFFFSFSSLSSLTHLLILTNLDV